MDLLGVIDHIDLGRAVGPGSFQDFAVVQELAVIARGGRRQLAARYDALLAAWADCAAQVDAVYEHNQQKLAQ